MTPSNKVWIIWYIWKSLGVSEKIVYVRMWGDYFHWKRKWHLSRLKNRGGWELESHFLHFLMSEFRLTSMDKVKDGNNKNSSSKKIEIQHFFRQCVALIMWEGAGGVWAYAWFSKSLNFRRTFRCRCQKEGSKSYFSRHRKIENDEMSTFRENATIRTQDVVSKLYRNSIENHVEADKILLILYIPLSQFDPGMKEMYAFENRGSELSPAPNIQLSWVCTIWTYWTSCGAFCMHSSRASEARFDDSASCSAHLKEKIPSIAPVFLINESNKAQFTIFVLYSHHLKRPSPRVICSTDSKLMATKRRYHELERQLIFSWIPAFSVCKIVNRVVKSSSLSHFQCF